jgi:hypothetical protein
MISSVAAMPKVKSGTLSRRSAIVTANAAAPMMEASPTNPHTITAISQARIIGTRRPAPSPETTPTSVATPLPPRKPNHTG